MKMPSIEKHVQTSLKRTGKDYREVHEWIDDPENKNERHNIRMILENAKMFDEKYGQDAAQEYVHHLADDLKGKFGHVHEDFTESMDNALTYFGAKNQ
jgi:hypothetical protein